MDERALPAGEIGGSFDVVFDRAEQGGDFGGLKVCDGGRELGFVGSTEVAPGSGIEAIDRLRTQVDQVAAGGLKCLKKVLVGDLEHFSHSSVEA